VPLENPTVHSQVLDQIMETNIKDTIHSWSLGPEDKYINYEVKSNSFSAHHYFMTNPSLSGVGSANREDEDKDE